MSLRAELVGESAGMPAFAVLLPAGWEATGATFGSMKPRMDAVLEQFPVAARAALRARVEQMLATARAEADRAEIVRMFAPANVSPEDYLPVSLVASWLRAPAGETLQQLGNGLMESRGASVLDPGGTILHWPMSQTATVEDGHVEVGGTGYLLPVPGHANVGLMFRSQILRGVGDSIISEEGERALMQLCDAIVASVRWRRA